MLRAILIMFVAMSLIPIGDGAGKLLVTREGFNPYFLAWSRFTLGALMVLPLLPKGPFDVRIFLDWRIWLRGLLIVCSISLILTALQTAPLPDVFGAFFVGPILSFFLSAWLLKERITKINAILLLIGFCGVLLVVKPGNSMSIGLGFAVLSGLFYGCFLTANRWLSTAAPPRALLFSHLAIGAVVLLPLGVTNVPIFTPSNVMLMTASAAASMAANLLLVIAYRMAPASRLAPFVYFQLLSATAIGWLVFGDWPDLLSVVGLLLLVGSGIAAALIKYKP